VPLLYDFLNIFSSASRCCGSNLLVPELFQNLCAASVIETETQRRSDGSKREIPLSPVFVAENFLEMMIKRFSFTFKPIALSRRKFGSSQHLLMKPVEQKLCEPADMGRRQFFNCGAITILGAWRASASIETSTRKPCDAFSAFRIAILSPRVHYAFKAALSAVTFDLSTIPSAGSAARIYRRRNIIRRQVRIVVLRRECR